MITAQANIKEYTDRLTTQDGVQVPTQPDAINGDSVAKLKDGTYAYDFKSVFLAVITLSGRIVMLLTVISREFMSSLATRL